MSDVEDVMNTTIRWTSGPMHLTDQGQGDSCWVLASDYGRLQDRHIALQGEYAGLLAKVAAFREQAAKCAFTDDHGHALEMNAAFIGLKP